MSEFFRVIQTLFRYQTETHFVAVAEELTARSFPDCREARIRAGGNNNVRSSIRQVFKLRVSPGQETTLRHAPRFGSMS